MTEKPHHLGHRERLKDRFNQGGAEAVADYELLELLLMQSIPRRDVKPLAKELLSRFGSISKILSASKAELKQFTGVGDSVVTNLKIVEAVAIKSKRDAIIKEANFADKLAILDFLYSKMADLKHEEFHVLYFDSKNNLLKDDSLFRGTVNKSAVYPREVMKEALALGATALLIAHNHPSGDPSPSISDDNLTTDMQMIAHAMGISLHDHIIIGDGLHYSYRDQGKLI